MPRRKAEVVEVTQRIDEDLLGDIEQYPTQIRRWFSSNIIQRVFSYLFGFTEDGFVRKLRVTRSGKLKVASAGSGFTEYDKVDGTAGDDYTSENTHEFPVAYDRFDILAEGGDLVISVKKEDGLWGKDRIIKEGMASVDFVITGIKVKNRNAGTNVYYEIVVYR